MKQKLKQMGAYMALIATSLMLTNCVRFTMTTTDDNTSTSNGGFITITNDDVTKKYSTREGIAELTGLTLPEFTGTSTSTFNASLFGKTAEVKSDITLKSAPSEEVFATIDSICALPVPEVIKEETKFFYTDFDGIVHCCWSREGNTYTFARKNDRELGGDPDTEFNLSLSIAKDSEQAKFIVSVKAK